MSLLLTLLLTPLPLPLPVPVQDACEAQLVVMDALLVALDPLDGEDEAEWRAVALEILHHEATERITKGTFSGGLQSRWQSVQAFERSLIQSRTNENLLDRTVARMESIGVDLDGVVRALKSTSSLPEWMCQPFKGDFPTGRLPSSDRQRAYADIVRDTLARAALVDDSALHEHTWAQRVRAPMLTLRRFEPTTMLDYWTTISPIVFVCMWTEAFSGYVEELQDIYRTAV